MAEDAAKNDPLRYHEEAVYNWLGGLRVDYGTADGLLSTPRSNFPILRVFASPDRAFASAMVLLVTSGWITGATAEQMRSNADISVLPLPLVSIDVDMPQPDATQARVPVAVRGGPSGGDPPDYTYPHPKHCKTSFNASFWVKNRASRNYVAAWLFSQFGTLGCHHNERLIPVVYPATTPYGTVNQSLKLNGLSARNELEGPGARYYRMDATLELRTWMIAPPVYVWG